MFLRVIKYFALTKTDLFSFNILKISLFLIYFFKVTLVKFKTVAASLIDLYSVETLVSIFVTTTFFPPFLEFEGIISFNRSNFKLSDFSFLCAQEFLITSLASLVWTFAVLTYLNLSKVSGKCLYPKRFCLPLKLSKVSAVCL
uniref:Uncharacterized protein n=1 Tax=Fomitiporia mediterranea TaxID=208960 RepID=A0A5B9RD77_9AGAM|nr:hypothetical protein Fomme_000090 [Fomitiporia mediterranea]QEG57100.1 hypothetical protein Fomme_000090 [Fomitiporia mediterranea]